MTQTTQDDEFLWLEDIDGERARAFVADRSSEVATHLRQDPRFERLRKSAAALYTATDRIPYSSYAADRVRNFWQDEANPRGIVRTTTLAEYQRSNPSWDLVLDIDDLARTENRNWVYKGMDSLAPEHDLGLVSLSRGGGDAVEIREFDIANKVFVKDGFVVPEAKTRIDWLDGDHLIIATDLGEGSLTTSGYPRILKKWQRGTSIKDAPILLTADVTDMMVSARTITRPERTCTFLIKTPGFFHETIYFLGPDDEAIPLPLPDDVDFRGVFNGRVLAMMRSDWVASDTLTLSQGSLVSIDLDRSAAAGSPVDPQVIYAPADNIAIDDVTVGRDSIYLSVLEDVSGSLLELTWQKGEWQARRIDLPTGGSINIVTTDPLSGIAMVRVESFLLPDSLYLLESDQPPRLIKSMPARFDASPYVSEQLFADSADGTRVPYYLIRARHLVRDGSTPTLTAAYGGFEVASKPSYLSALGIAWLQGGGAFVVANIRGGGEYGPRWHTAALRENRNRAFEDYIAVHEALIASGVTTPPRLGIRGGSNGGLLVTAVMVMRPDLYGAVICAVPLIDMLRYHRLSAGASWMAEYGDPDIPADRKFISQYSPFQNVKAGVSYPRVFFWTNTRDDRVHPSHARRMVAKMRMQGHDVIYFENTEGGHGGGANPNALADTTALELVYLKQQLGMQ